MRRIQPQQRLTTSHWESALRDAIRDSSDEETWLGILTADDFFLDLSHVEFADFGALGRSLLFVQAVINKGSTLRVHLPNGHPTPSELESLQRRSSPTAQAATARSFLTAWRTRGNCRIYLRQTGFEAILESRRRAGKLSITENASPTNLDSILEQLLPARDPQPVRDSLPLNPRRILPFAWVRAADMAEFERSETFTGILTHLQDLGIATTDANSLAHTIMAELIENVALHSQLANDAATEALIGAILLHPQTFASRIQDLDKGMRSYASEIQGSISPVLRLFIADSGSGIIPDLHMRKPRPTSSRRETAVSENLSPEQDTILYAFSRTATSKSASTQPTPELGGLYRVEWLVRSYRGATNVRTATTSAGKGFAKPGRDLEFGDEDLAWVPGTSFDFIILTRPDIPLDVPLDIRDSKLPPASRPRSNWLHFETNSLLGLSPVQLGEYWKTLASTEHAGNMNLVVTVTMTDTPFDSADIAARRIISQLSRPQSAPRAIPVALVFPNIPRRAIELAIHAEIDGDHLRGTDLLLICGPPGYHYWLGADDDTSKILMVLEVGLQGLSSDYLPVSEMSQGDSAIAEIPARLWPWIHERDGQVRLSLSAGALIDQLVLEIASEFMRHIEADENVNIVTGKFLTPTLRLIDRWVNVEGLLRDLSLTELAGFLLAYRVWGRLGLAAPRAAEAPIVLRIPAAPEGTARTLSDALGAGSEYLDWPDAVSLLSRERDPTGHDGQPVILCADILLTGDAAIEAIERIQPHGSQEVIVAAVFDAREEPSSTLDTHFGEIPVVSLSVLSLQEPINHVESHLEEQIIQPENWYSATRRQAPTLLHQGSYISILRKSDAVRLAHIARPAGRHFSAYIDVWRLFMDPSRRQVALKPIVDAIESQFDTFPGLERIVVAHPGDDSDRRGWVVSLIVDALRARGRPVEESPLALKRLLHNDQWIMKTQLERFKSNTQLVVFDAVASTGSTVRGCLRLAADAGASAVCVAVFLNGLPAAEAWDLHNIRHVETEIDDAWTRIPAQVSFVARTASASMRATECTICRLRSTYGSIQGPLPTRMESHRRWLVAELAPRTRGKAFSAATADLFRLAIEPVSAVAYLRLKALLRGAENDTQGRRRILEMLRELQRDGDRSSVRRDALIELLAAENHWLDRPPLRFREVRDVLWRIVTRVLLSKRNMSYDGLLRMQAGMIAARVDSTQFVAQLPALVLLNTDHLGTLQQLLLEAYRLAALGSTATSRLRLQLADSLEQLAEDLTDVLRSRGADNELTALMHEVKFLQNASGHVSLVARGSRRESWRMLREVCDVVDQHEYDNVLWGISQCIELLVRGERPDGLQSYIEAWQACARYIDTRILPHLPPLKDILDSPHVALQIPDAAMSAWSRFVYGYGRELLDQVSVDLQAADTDFATAETLASLRENIRWIRDFLLGTSSDQFGEKRFAFLPQLIQTCPVDLGQALANAFGNYIDLSRVGGEVKVFVSQSVLQRSLNHIRMNSEKYEIGHGGIEFLIEVVPYGRDSVEVQVRNSGTRRSDDKNRGRGLSALDGVLGLFGGAIFGTPNVPPPWTFLTTLRLERW